MTKKDKLKHHLVHHLHYEVEGLYHAYEKLFVITDRKDWNAYFVSFATHVRVVYDFLTNASKGKESNNCHAKDYVGEVKLGEKTKAEEKEKAIIGDKVHELDWQVFHFTKRRAHDATEKFNTADATRVLKWLIDALAEFTNQLPQPTFPRDWEPKVPQLIESETEPSACTPGPTTTTSSETIVAGSVFPKA